MLKQWLGIADVQDLLKEKIQKLNPKRIYAAFDLGLISSYPDLFVWLKGRSLNELIDIEGEQSVFAANVVYGGAANGCAYAVDKTGLVWIQGVHPASWLSHKKMMDFALSLASHQ